MLAFMSIGTSVSSPSTSFIFSISACGPTSHHHIPLSQNEIRCHQRDLVAAPYTRNVYVRQPVRVHLTQSLSIHVRVGDANWLITTREAVPSAAPPARSSLPPCRSRLSNLGQELHQQDHPDHAEGIGDAVTDRDGCACSGMLRANTSIAAARAGVQVSAPVYRPAARSSGIFSQNARPASQCTRQRHSRTDRNKTDPCLRNIRKKRGPACKPTAYTNSSSPRSCTALGHLSRNGQKPALQITPLRSPMKCRAKKSHPAWHPTPG